MIGIGLHDEVHIGSLHADNDDGDRLSYFEYDHIVCRRDCHITIGSFGAIPDILPAEAR